MDEKKRWILGSLLIVATIALCTIGAIVYQNHKLQKEEEAAQRMLNQMNSELESMNKQLEQDLNKEMKARGFNTK